MWQGELCASCMTGSCCDKQAACETNATCMNLIACIVNCTTEACWTACENNHPGGVHDLNALFGCMEGSCELACGEPLGNACASDGDCVTGARCIKATGYDYFGAAVAHGYCAVDCTDFYASGGTTESPCDRFGGLCVGATDLAYCHMGCEFGDDDAKCHDRYDATCFPVLEGNTIVAGYCRPQCQKNSDCASGRACDLPSGTCVVSGEEHGGAPDGTACQLDDACRGGVCLDFGTAKVCGSGCTLGHPESCNPLGTVGDSASPATICAVGSAGVAVSGDLGYCIQLCDKAADCLNHAEGATCDLSWKSQIGHGICDF